MIVFDVEQKRLPKPWQFSDAFLVRTAHVFATVLPHVQGEVHVHVVDDEEIRRLNRMHRGKDKVTDVLSFPSGDVAIFGHLGDVIISFAQAERQAEGDIELELVDLLIHGTLHLLGYDHEEPADAEEMFPLQDRIVGEVLSSV